MPERRNSFEKERAAKANLVTLVGSLLNLLLTLFKFFAGIVGRSSAMLADAFHSLSDFVTDLVVIFSFAMVKKPADESHDYGHGKFETLATFLVGLALVFAGGGILFSALKKIYKFLFLKQELGAPGVIALIAALLSVIIKEWLYHFTVKTGRNIGSQALIANAWHHRSDALSSVGTTLGIGGALLFGEKYRLLDPLAAVIVSIFIIIVAVKIVIVGLKELLEESLDEETEKTILKIAGAVSGVIEPHDLKTRKLGNGIVIDLHIRVANNTSVENAHKINDQVEMKLRERFGQQTQISIHTEPENE